MNEGRLARRNITKAQVMLAEAELLGRKGKYDEAASRLFDAGICVRSAEASLRPIIDRYADRSQVATWKRWVDETVHESKARGTTAIVVSKVDRNLIVYKNGVPVRRYDVGLGRNGFADKLYSGDNATPREVPRGQEGRPQPLLQGPADQLPERGGPPPLPAGQEAGSGARPGRHRRAGGDPRGGRRRSDLRVHRPRRPLHGRGLQHRRRGHPGDHR